MVTKKCKGVKNLHKFSNFLAMDMMFKKVKEFFTQDLTKNSQPAKDLQLKFSEVYKNNLFLGRQSRSGEGSDNIQTAIVQQELPKIVKDYQIKTFLDAPCGDWFWMKNVNLSCENYIGIDIVEEIIQNNTKQFANERHRFECLNVTSDILPSADLVFSRDCLVHLSYEDINKALRNFKKSGIKYLLTTTFTDRSQNTNPAEKKNFKPFWRPLNLECAPFNFPKPLLLINEGCTEGQGKFSDKSIGLWLLSDIQVKD